MYGTEDVALDRNWGRFNRLRFMVIFLPTANEEKKHGVARMLIRRPEAKKTSMFESL